MTDEKKLIYRVLGADEKPIGGENLRRLLIGNSQFKHVWIGGKLYEMPDDEPPVSGVRRK